jgi:hypothetical protein
MLAFRPHASGNCVSNDHFPGRFAVLDWKPDMGGGGNVTEPSAVGSTESDGVLVVRAIAQGTSGARLFRVTSESGTSPEAATAVVADAADLHRVVDAWLTSLRD